MLCDLQFLIIFKVLSVILFGGQKNGCGSSVVYEIGFLSGWYLDIIYLRCVCGYCYLVVVVFLGEMERGVIVGFDIGWNTQEIIDIFRFF